MRSLSELPLKIPSYHVFRKSFLIETDPDNCRQAHWGRNRNFSFLFRFYISKRRLIMSTIAVLYFLEATGKTKKSKPKDVDNKDAAQLRRFSPPVTELSWWRQKKEVFYLHDVISTLNIRKPSYLINKFPKSLASRWFHR